MAGFPSDNRLVALAQNFSEAPLARQARPYRPRLASERVMVCMAPDRSAATALISGAALAERLHAMWFAVYVVTPTRGWRRFFANQDTAALDRNIKLAETLGATVVKVIATEVTNGLIEFASRECVTHVIVGRSVRSPSIFGQGTTIGAFVNGIRGVELQVVANRDSLEESDPVLRVGSLSRGLSILIWLGIVVGTVGLIAIAPWPVAFLIAVAVAGGWSWWLERRRR